MILQNSIMYVIIKLAISSMNSSLYTALKQVIANSVLMGMLFVCALVCFSLM